MEIDLKIQKDVIDELQREPTLPASEIGVLFVENKLEIEQPSHASYE